MNPRFSKQRGPKGRRDNSEGRSPGLHAVEYQAGRRSAIPVVPKGPPDDRGGLRGSMLHPPTPLLMHKSSRGGGMTTQHKPPPGASPANVRQETSPEARRAGETTAKGRSPGLHAAGDPEGCRPAIPVAPKGPPDDRGGLRGSLLHPPNPPPHAQVVTRRGDEDRTQATPHSHGV
ncbi:MAG: hypothetical protein AKCLJLPJ_00335 [Fimbriimonadales bacterium]|nr:hypothetical protein [Fimbriimonadales bacterium]